MMRRLILGAVVLCTLLLVATARPAAAQGLASLAIAASGSSMTVEKAGTCFSCEDLAGGLGSICKSGPGGPKTYITCSSAFNGGCIKGRECVGLSLVPLDLDGASQYVSAGSRLGIPVVHREGDPDVTRNCKGAVIGRFQTPDAIAQVRASTGTLTL